MPNPKQKHSKSRTRRKRANKGLKPLELGKCDHCGRKKLNHHVCDHCGNYKGRQIIDTIK